MAQRAQELPRLKVIPRGRATSTKSKPRVSLSTALWLPATLLYGFGDVITTWLVLRAGGTEVNPISAPLVGATGSIWPLILVKVAVFGSLILLAHFGLRQHKWIVPALASCFGAGLVIHNLLAFSAL
jgi:hypothetical protein